MMLSKLAQLFAFYINYAKNNLTGEVKSRVFIKKKFVHKDDAYLFFEVLVFAALIE